VEEAAIAHPDNGPGVLTLSFGCAVYDPEEAPRCEREARAVLQAADEALYRAKQLGRNRVELAPPVGTAAVALPGISE
jgi:PleD family two-component response regulator